MMKKYETRDWSNVMLSELFVYAPNHEIVVDGDRHTVEFYREKEDQEFTYW